MIWKLALVHGHMRIWVLKFYTSVGYEICIGVQSISLWPNHISFTMGVLTFTFNNICTLHISQLISLLSFKSMDAKSLPAVTDVRCGEVRALAMVK